MPRGNCHGVAKEGVAVVDARGGADRRRGGDLNTGGQFRLPLLGFPRGGDRPPLISEVVETWALRDCTIALPSGGPWPSESDA
jgi:hypothetical protein